MSTSLTGRYATPERTKTGAKETASPAPVSPHLFNRFEIKYLVAEEDIPRLRDSLTQRLDFDPLSPEGGYRVESLYFDSPDLRFYYEKIEGLKFRRKLRIRRYGDGVATADSQVSVEIKQRVNKVTQKRRLNLGFADAMALCDASGESVGYQALPEDLIPKLPERDHALVNEISAFVVNNRLRPIATTTYKREAFAGKDAESGARVTIDHGVSGRDRDFLLGDPDAENRPTVDQRFAVVEIKADERVPFWLTDLTAHHGMSVIRMSKYCNSVEAFHLRPASAIGSVDPIHFA
ncbi:polyphosphate polymerase domain-containing protein [Corynebacterium alimapuense]|uniref:Vacuolar transporter n=1 Tax=Corynebacterium alimapuense TaxID=1576874 RepID=A0A3M8K500_9CORY|nr:polyphosphate polymerase domain-containing protein [Corynebacterium alimapuense]RNE48276.1 vacuolar transporter [Corynebacterium alimapuense]